MSKPLNPRIICANGTSLSVQASVGHGCIPLNDEGPYTHVEVGSIGSRTRRRPYGWSKYGDGPYARVPVEVVAKFIDRNGGIISGSMP